MCSGCNASDLRANKEGESRVRCDESRRSKYVTEYELAPCFEILQSCSQLGVKQGQTLGKRFVALLGEGLQSLFFMPDGLIHPSAWRKNSTKFAVASLPYAGGALGHRGGAMQHFRHVVAER